MSLANGNPVFQSVGGDASAATVTYTATGATVATTMSLSAVGVLLASTAATSSSAAEVANEAKSAVSGFNDALTKATEGAVQTSQIGVAGGVVGIDAGGGINLTTSTNGDNNTYINLGKTGATNMVKLQFVSASAVSQCSGIIAWGGTGNNDGCLSIAGSELIPDSSNTTNLGTSGNAWAAIVSQTAVQIISDANDKTIVGTIGDSAYADVTTKLRAVWADISGVVFTLKDGQSNRQHIGVIAQTVQAAFQKQGLDAADFGVWCSDPKTKAVQTVVDGKTVTTIEPVYEADGTTQATQQTIRYEELLSLGLFCERLDHVDLVTRVAALEAKASTATA